MSEQQDGQTPDVMQLWRDWLTQTERQFNAFTAESMGSENFARSMGSVMEAYTSIQRLMTEVMQRYLTFMNMPSKVDVSGLAETLRDIDERLRRIEETLQIAAEHVDGAAAEPAAEPARTRVPPGFAPDNGQQVHAGAVPDELRR
jgi:polyhydroxyalkanoic acid synthase PhaR subunit